MADEKDVDAVIAAIKQSKKYRDTGEETIRELAIAALRQHKKPKAAVKAVRKRLHSIMAPYLGDPDYERAAQQLSEVFTVGDPEAIKQVCADIMATHLSTRERLPLLESFYARIFEVTGRPTSILDIACGLNPLAFPWMGLEGSIDFYVYDIHEPRIVLLNHYFQLQGLMPMARLQDVALSPPRETADLALFLKEMPRFERNYHGRGRPLLEAIQARWLVVSYPTVSTHGGRNLTNRYRAFMQQLLADKTWPVTELLFEGELLFCIEKTEGG